MTIDSYHFGRVRIDGTQYTRDLIVGPDGVRPDWWRAEGHRLAAEDLGADALAAVLAEPPEVLVIGTGCFGRMEVPPETVAALEARGIRPLALRTGKAVAAYNRLAAEHARVVAALHLTC